MDIVLPTGARLVVSEASYQDVDALMTALANAGIGVQLANDLLNMDVTILKDALLKSYASQALKDAIFKCAQRAVYENTKVTRGLFDDPKLKDKARADHFLILWEVVKVNCTPFFAQIFSVLKERLGTNPSFLKPTSGPGVPS